MFRVTSCVGSRARILTSAHLTSHRGRVLGIKKALGRNPSRKDRENTPIMLHTREDRALMKRDLMTAEEVLGNSGEAKARREGRAPEP